MRLVDALSVCLQVSSFNFASSNTAEFFAPRSHPSPRAETLPSSVGHADRVLHRETRHCTAASASVAVHLPPPPKPQVLLAPSHGSTGCAAKATAALCWTTASRLCSLKQWDGGCWALRETCSTLSCAGLQSQQGWLLDGREQTGLVSAGGRGQAGIGHG